MAQYHTVLTFEGTCAEDLVALRVYLHQFFIFKHNAARRVRERPGATPFSLRIAAVQDALQEIANVGIAFVPYALKRGLRVVTYLHYLRPPSPGYQCVVTVGPGDTLSTLLVEGETLGYPPEPEPDDAHLEQSPKPGTRRVDLYTVLKVRPEARLEAFFKEKLRYYVDLELVQFVPVVTNLEIVAAKEAFPDVLAAGRDYGRLNDLNIPMVCIMGFSTSELREVPLTNLVTVWSLQREGYSVGHFLHTQELPDSFTTKPKKAIPDSERTLTDAERARAAVTRGGSAGKEVKEFEAAFEASLRENKPGDLVDSKGLKIVNVPLEDRQFGEFQLQQNHQDSLTEILGWKPWKERDDVVYNGRCQCKLYEATILAQPCEHLCLCRACYSTYQTHPVLAERCPRCSAPVKTYEELDAPDDFMVIEPISRAAQEDDPTARAVAWPEAVPPEESRLRRAHQEAIRDLLGWKPWIEADDTLFSGRCQCKSAKATVLAQPCDHVCFCHPCYEVYKAHSSLTPRCPRCSCLVDAYEELYAPDDFMIEGPDLSVDEDEKWDKVEVDEEGFQDVV
jgi:hypothetical protein